ncbi:MAG: 3-dehydroquinate synthase [Crocinitomicaceae bacterium]|nr:3-dehydroquinate synthase [Crocinitomicaceae bacterium]
MYALQNIDCPIEIGSLVDSNFSTLVLKEYSNSKIIIIADENTNEHCLDYLITSFEFLSTAEVMLLPVGEENKTIDVCHQVWEALSEYGIGRRDLVINLGGGVVTDMGGFIASLYKRGVDFIHIPTTFLGMIDASIGGKNGVDLDIYKNQLGVFRFPKAIFIDKTFLETLPIKEMVNGYAEALKHGLIKDVSLWQKLVEIEDLLELKDDLLLRDIASIKVAVVNDDPQEKGFRKILNFGHTMGHAIEGYYLQSEAKDHGYCVALGMLMESFVSQKLGILPKDAFFEIEQTILNWYPIPTIPMDDFPTIIELLYNDKKNHSGKIQCCLLDGIGSCLYDQPVTEQLFMDSLVYLMSKSSTSLN